jgi:hypothetical protein
MTTLNPEMKSILIDLVTIERADLLGDVMDFLTGVGSEVHDHAFQSILGRYDVMDPSALISEIELTLSEITDNMLTQHGVLMIDGDLKARLDILTTLYGIPRYGDPQAILDIVNDDSDSAESRLADLTTLFTENEVGDEILNSIVEVKYSLLDLIKETVERVADIDAPTILTDHMPAATLCRNAFKVFITNHDGKGLLVTELIRRGFGFALDFEVYLASCFDTIAELETPEAAVKELVAIAIASNLTLEEYSSVISEHMESFTGVTSTESLVTNAISTYC